MVEKRRLEEHEVLVFGTVRELRAWFAKHHAKSALQWIGYWKKDSGRKGVPYEEALDEALCFGWIDGIVKRVDDECYANRWTPRKPGGAWSEVNVRRMAELIAAGRVAPAGLAAFEARDHGRTRAQAEARRDPALAPAHLRALRANRAAWADWTARPPGYRRLCAVWVESAKQEATRERRLRTLIECGARGENVPPLNTYGREGGRSTAPARSTGPAKGAAVAKRAGRAKGR